MSDPTHHTIERPWDAPFDAIRIAYSFTPGCKQSWDDPGEPDDVVPLLCRSKVSGEWIDLSEPFLTALAPLLHDDMVMEAREEIAESRSYARAATREMVERAA